MASNPTQEIQDEFLNTMHKSQETVIDAIKASVEAGPVHHPEDPLGAGAGRRQAAQA